ncbi:MAG TPA: hypothetical protein ENI15_01235, partial [Spirochaetes bacterium]|nr:hypothetical protein [Spirochaetota bacterium]
MSIQNNFFVTIRVMIGYLRGELVQVDDEACVIDVNGVGYNVYCS